MRYTSLFQYKFIKGVLCYILKSLAAYLIPMCLEYQEGHIGLWF